MTTDLAELERAATKASPLPWVYEETSDQYDDRDDESTERTGWFRSGPATVDTGDFDTFRAEDAEYVALLVNVAPDLIAAARRAETAEAQVLALREAGESLFDECQRILYDFNENPETDALGEWRRVTNGPAGAAQVIEARIRADERERIAADVQSLIDSAAHESGASSDDMGDPADAGSCAYLAGLEDVLAILAPAPEEANITTTDEDEDPEETDARLALFAEAEASSRASHASLARNEPEANDAD